MSRVSCNQYNINDTDTAKRQGKTTNFKHKSSKLSHSKYFLQTQFSLLGKQKP